MQEIRRSVVLKAHGLLLRLHPLASAPSHGAQLPGAHAQRTGARRDVVAGAQAMCKGHGKTCAKDNAPGMKWKQALTSGNPLQKGCTLSHLPVSFFLLFPLSGRLFQSFIALRLGFCSSNIQPDCICGGFILICPWASIVIYPTQHFSLPLSFSPTAGGEHSSPRGFFASSFSLYSGRPRKSTPAFEYFKGLFSSVCIVQYFCFLGVSGAYSLTW